MVYLLYGLGYNDFNENHLIGIYTSYEKMFEELEKPNNIWDNVFLCCVKQN